MLVKPERAKIFQPEEEAIEEAIDAAETETMLGDILGGETEDETPESDDEPVGDDPAFNDAEESAEVEAAEVVDDDRQFWYEAELLAKIADASRERESALAVVLGIKEDLKEAKEELSAVESRLFRYTAELGRKLEPQVKAQPAAEAISDAETEAEDTAWRDLSTTELLTGLAGIGKKKIESLAEVAPTVGDLEDLRGKASEQHKSFAELLPKGFGQKAVDAIEDALIDHIANFSSSVTPADPAQPYQHFPWVLEQEKDCRSKLSSYEPPLPSDSDYEWYSDGAESFANCAPITECPVRSEEISEDDQIDWMYGWLMAEKLKG